MPNMQEGDMLPGIPAQGVFSCLQKMLGEGGASMTKKIDEFRKEWEAEEGCLDWGRIEHYIKAIFESMKRMVVGMSDWHDKEFEELKKEWGIRNGR